MSDKDSYVATANGAEGVRVNQYDAISGDIVKSDFIPHKELTDKQKLEALLTSFGVDNPARTSDGSEAGYDLGVIYFDVDGSYCWGCNHE